MLLKTDNRFPIGLQGQDSNHIFGKFWNPSTFAHETADIKLAYFQSAVLWANVDGF